MKRTRIAPRTNQAEALGSLLESTRDGCPRVIDRAARCPGRDALCLGARAMEAKVVGAKTQRGGAGSAGRTSGLDEAGPDRKSGCLKRYKGIFSRFELGESRTRPSKPLVLKLRNQVDGGTEKTGDTFAKHPDSASRGDLEGDRITKSDVNRGGSAIVQRPLQDRVEPE